jgi:hypothetical protein
MTIHETIGEELAGFGGYLRCETCGTTRPLGDPSDRLRDGWPKCGNHGTMRWWTQRQIVAGEVPELAA